MTKLAGERQPWGSTQVDLVVVVVVVVVAVAVVVVVVGVDDLCSDKILP